MWGVVWHMHQLRCEWCQRYSHGQVSFESYTNLLVEAHVEEAVGLVQHQPAQLVGPEGRGLLKVIQQAARAGDQHRDALAQTRLLLVALLTAKYASSHLYHTLKLSGVCAIHRIHVGCRELQAGVSVSASAKQGVRCRAQYKCLSSQNS